ncbi:MAG: AMP-binding protein [Candidatus Aenigmarchaeota archaeon]|nr:AMP-binding protein [Candidatus Aenigmarchaeota archaeon]
MFDDFFECQLQQDAVVLEEVFDSRDWDTDVDPLSLPHSFWGNIALDFMDSKQRDVMLSSFFRYSLRRGLKVMPLYASAQYAKLDPFCVRKLSDFVRVPLLLKDGNLTAGLAGFREKSHEVPEILLPADVRSSHVYKSGGTKGLSTPTYITDADLVIEAYSLARRSFLAGGMRPQERLYSCYNPTHKGGELIKRAGALIGKKTVLLKRPEDDIVQCIRDLRAHKITTIAAVQPPVSSGSDSFQQIKKGTSFLNLFEADHSLFGAQGQVKKAFVTGYQLPQEIIALAEDVGLSLFTAWGATEAIVGATSTVTGPPTRLCKFNAQHLVVGPHFLAVAKIVDERLKPAEEGEDGIVLVNTLAREGTLYFNYAIGDMAHVLSKSCPCGRTTPVVSNIRRIDNPAEVFGVGCRYD